MADKKISALPAASTPLAGTEVLPVVQSGTTDKVSVSDLTSGRTVDMAVANAVLNDAGTNSVSYPLVATHTSTGTTAAGFGVGVNFVQENSTYSTNIQVATIESICTAEPDIHNDLIFKTKYNNTLAERARIKNGADFVLANGNFVPSTAGKGIDFSANTHAAGMTKEVLDWYEEGVFTPTLTGSSTAITLTYTEQTGKYTRVGRLVTLHVYVKVNTVSGAGSGFLVLNTGLWNSDGTPASGSVTIGKIAFTEFVSAQMRGSGSSSLVFYSSSTAGGPVTINAADVVSGSEIYATITYIAA